MVLASGLVVAPLVLVWLPVEPSESPQSVAVSAMLGSTTVALVLGVVVILVVSALYRTAQRLLVLAVASLAIVGASTGIDAMVASAGTSVVAGGQPERLLLGCIGLALVTFVIDPGGSLGRVQRMLTASLVAFAVVVASVEIMAAPDDPTRMTTSVLALVVCSFMVGLAAITNGLQTRSPLLTGTGILVTLTGAARAAAPDFSYVGPGPVVLGLAGATAAAIGASMAMREARSANRRAQYERKLAESLERTRLNLTNQAYMARAHDQQSSLMAIEAAARRLESGLGDSELAQAVVMEAQRLQRMFDLRHRPAPAYVDIVPIVQAVLQCNKSIGVRIEYHGPASLSAVTDGDRLAEALQSLLDNARTHGAGTTRVTTSQDDDTVFVDVSDDGSGVPRALRDVVFERGVTRNPDSHTGLGLFTARTDLRSIGGDLRILDSGTARGFFRIEMPIRHVETPTDDLAEIVDGSDPIQTVQQW